MCIPSDLSSFGPRLLGVHVLIIEFEVTRWLCFVGCVVFVNEPEAEFDAMLTEDISHRPAIDIGKSRGITEWNSFVFVERNRGRNTLVFVVFELFADKFA